MGDSFIITGGLHSTTAQLIATSLIYTEDAGWKNFTALPDPPHSHCQVTLGDSVYVVGGWTAGGPTGNTYSLSLSSSSSKQWVKQKSLNTPRFWHDCAEWDGGIIAVGGYNDDAGGELSSVEKYNPVSNKWSTSTPLLTPLRFMQAFVWENDLYLLGGGGSKKVFKLKQNEDKWEELLTLPNGEMRSIFPAVTLSSIHCA